MVNPSSAENTVASGPEQEALSLDDRKWRALLDKDLGTLAALLADDLVFIHSNARLDTKAGYLDSLGSGSLTYERVHRSETQGVVHGSAAVVTGRAQVELLSRGQQRRLDVRYTGVWVLGPRPQLVAWQSTLIPQMPVKP